MATAEGSSAAAVALAVMHRKRPQRWREDFDMQLSRDPANERLWRHQRVGRPPVEWEDLLVRAVGPDWHQWARTVSEAQFLSRSLPALYSQMRLDRAHRRIFQGEREPDHGDASSDLVRAAAPPEARAWPPGTGLQVAAKVDARWLADVLSGLARPPRQEPLASWWRGTLRRAELLWRAGVRWHARGPVQWVPRDLNSAADWLVQAAVEGPLQFLLPASAVASRSGGVQLRLRAFSDGGLSSSTPARWGAVVFLEAGGRLQLMAAAAGWAAVQTVPAAELEAGHNAWCLVAWVSRLLAAAEPVPLPEALVQGRELTEFERGQLQVWAELAWLGPAGDRARL